MAPRRTPALLQPSAGRPGSSGTATALLRARRWVVAPGSRAVTRVARASPPGQFTGKEADMNRIFSGVRHGLRRLGQLGRQAGQVTVEYVALILLVALIMA